PPEVSTEAFQEGFRIRVRSRGFERIWPGLVLTRTFEVTEDHFQVTDEFAGSGSHRVESFFHFHPNVEVTPDGGNRLSCPVGEGSTIVLDAAGPGDFSFGLAKGARKPEHSGWFCPQYGRLVPTWTAVWRGRSRLPFRNQFTLRRADGRN
ncbi:MAG: heparinase II/III family protein, partial [Candidatus Bipolaricaulota bacterium]